MELLWCSAKSHPRDHDYPKLKLPGGEQPLIINNLRELISFNKPRILILSETKKKMGYLKKWRRRFGYHYAFYVDPFGLSSGLVLGALMYIIYLFCNLVETGLM